jgi:hypothetical protein
MLMLILILILLPMCVESMVSSSSISNHGRIKPPLRGGGFGRGMKRPREKQTEHRSVGNSARGWEPDDGRAPRSKVPRRSWWNLWGDRGAMPSILGDAVQSAFESAKRLFSWSLSPSSPGRKQSDVDKDGRLVFEGDNDKPAAIKRQIAFYFSDSNLPTGEYDMHVGLCSPLKCYALVVHPLGYNLHAHAWFCVVTHFSLPAKPRLP